MYKRYIYISYSVLKNRLFIRTRSSILRTLKWHGNAIIQITLIMQLPYNAITLLMQLPL